MVGYKTQGNLLAFFDRNQIILLEMEVQCSSSKMKMIKYQLLILLLTNYQKMLVEFKSYLSNKNIVQFSKVLVNGSVKDQRLFIDSFFISKSSVIICMKFFFPETCKF